MPIDNGRRKHCRNRHGGAQSLRERAAVEYLHPADGHVRCHAAKWNGQIVKIDGRWISQSRAVEKQSHFVSGIHPEGYRYTMLQTQFETVRKCLLVLLTPEAQILKAGGAAENGVPVDILGKLTNGGRRLADGIEPAYQATHARTGHDIDRNMMLFEKLDCAYVSEAQCSSAFQHQADTRAGTGSLCRQQKASGERACGENRAYLCHRSRRDGGSREPREQFPGLVRISAIRIR